MKKGSAMQAAVAPHLPETITSLVATRRTSTPIRRAAVVTGDGISALAQIIGDRPALVAIGPTVDRLYGARIMDALNRAGNRCAKHVVPTGEERKGLQTVEGVIQAASAVGLSRDGVIIGIGGGVLLDMVGLAASLFRRGVAHIKVGTTLVAQVDAAVGLKCGVNSGGSKNIAGAFFPPEAVITDGQFLSSLEERDVRCGLSEMIKLAVASDPELFDQLATNGALLINPRTRDAPAARTIVDRSIARMVSELNTNPFEVDLRRRVDFGHTVSGTYEVASGYALAHGEAVALDLALFSALGMLMGSLTEDELDRILRLLQGLGIDVWHPIMEDEALLERGLTTAASHRGRRLNLPIPDGIGQTRFIEDRSDLPPGLILDALSVVRRAAATQKPGLGRE